MNEKIQLAGFGDVDSSVQQRVIEIAEKACTKFDRHFKDYTLGFHLKGLHKVESSTKKSAPPKEKYELHVHLQTANKKYASKETEWDLVKLAHLTLDNVQSEVEHSVKKK